MSKVKMIIKFSVSVLAILIVIAGHGYAGLIGYSQHDDIFADLNFIQPINSLDQSIWFSDFSSSDAAFNPADPGKNVFTPFGDAITFTGVGDTFSADSASNDFMQTAHLLTNNTDDYLGGSSYNDPNYRITIGQEAVLLTGSKLPGSPDYYGWIIDGIELIVTEFSSELSGIVINDTPLYSTNISYRVNYYATPLPEPATMLLLASGLAGLAAFRRRFRK